METRELTGGEAIIQGLLAHDIDTVFALPGAQIYGLIDAFAKNGDRLRTIGARHEQTCGYMAFGYARASGKPGVFAVVPGPGILNASAALLTANSCNARVLALTGDMPSGAKGRERGALHELRDQLGILRSLTKWADHIEHPSQASLLVARAFQEMSSGRQGATALQAAWDYFTAIAGVGPAVTLPLFPAPELDLDAIDEAAKLIHASRAPMLVVGSGALHASAEVTALAEMIGAPAVSFRGGRIRSVQPQVDYLGVIRDVLPRDGFFVEEISQMGFSAMFGFPVYEPRAFVTSGYQGTLGFGFPTALGAKVAFPQRPVVSVTGDGGFMFAAQELATAESFGVSASSVSSPQALRPALERAFAADRPVLIEVKVPRGSEGDPWKFIHPTFS